MYSHFLSNLFELHILLYKVYNKAPLYPICCQRRYIIAHEKLIYYGEFNTFVIFIQRNLNLIEKKNSNQLFKNNYFLTVYTCSNYGLTFSFTLDVTD